MRVALATICDYATVREGLLTVVSAGVNRLWRDQVPAPMNICLAVLLEVEQDSRADIHDFELVISGPDGAQVAKAEGAIQAGASLREVPEPEELAYIPLALDLRGVPAPVYGLYTMRIRVSQADPLELRFKVSRRPDSEPRSQIRSPMTGPH